MHLVLLSYIGARIRELELGYINECLDATRIGTINSKPNFTKLDITKPILTNKEDTKGFTGPVHIGTKIQIIVPPCMHQVTLQSSNLGKHL